MCVYVHNVCVPVAGVGDVYVGVRGLVELVPSFHLHVGAEN